MSAALALLLDDLEEASGPVAAVRSTFDRMAIAEEEIAAAKRRCPRKARALHDAFAILCPPPVLRGHGEGLYRLHARELLSRVKMNEDVAPGTDAEVAAVLSAATLAAPPNADHAAAYALVFARLFPDKRELHEGFREYQPGEAARIVARLRAKIGSESGRGKART